jgi:hypothetical protein
MASLRSLTDFEPVKSEIAALFAARVAQGSAPGCFFSVFDEDGPVFVIGCRALVHAIWTAIGDDPLGEVLDVVSPLVDSAIPGRGRIVAEALVVAFSDLYACERAADVELLESLGSETSGDPLRDLVSAGVVAPADALRVGLEVLTRLAELCKTESVSVLDRAASAAG